MALQPTNETNSRAVKNSMLGKPLQMDVDHPVVLGYFPSTSMAELALTDLTAQGVTEQDYALVKIGEVADPDDELDFAMEPMGNTRMGLQVEAEGNPEFESAIGAGIATSGPNDDVTNVAEMDDGDDAAEDLMFPTSGHSFGDEERRDVATAANTGFFETTKPDRLPSAPAERTEIEQFQDGPGVVIGEGSLVDYLAGGQGNLSSLLENLGQSRTVGKGSILAVDVMPDGPNRERVVETLTANKADTVEQFDPPVQLW